MCDDCDLVQWLKLVSIGRSSTEPISCLQHQVSSIQKRIAVCSQWPNTMSMVEGMKKEKYLQGFGNEAHHIPIIIGEDPCAIFGCTTLHLWDRILMIHMFEEMRDCLGLGKSRHQIERKQYHIIHTGCNCMNLSINRSHDPQWVFPYMMSLSGFIETLMQQSCRQHFAPGDFQI